MGRIARLSPELANQIAAGEVVERPASVVKELAENALDAGATRIAIAMEMGGKKLIRVEDDGYGMDPDDARLALERHATSKIARSEDLEAIRTMGFRGEALPSIASVSHMVLRTRPREATAGTEIRINGGIVSSVTETGMAPGTIIEVGELFYNLPARRKFLKSDVAEATQVSRMVTLLALGYPEVGFTLTSGPRTLLRVPPVMRIEERFYQIYGERLDLVRVHREGGGLSVMGWVAALSDEGPTRGVQQFFINRRIIKDRTIAHAVVDAYARATARERSPEAHLFIDMPPDTVDVNVHPTKAEVRFRHQSLVHEVIRRAVSEAIGTPHAPDIHLVPPPGFTPERPPEPQPGTLPNVLSNLWPVDGPGPPPEPAPWEPGGTRNDEGNFAPFPSPVSGQPVAAAPSGQANGTLGEIAMKPLMPLGQFRHTFIIAVDDDGVAIIDQHVAHERVLYERIMGRLTAGTLESQRLLAPMVLEMSPDARAVLVERADELHQCGFDIEEFGPSSVRVASMPVLLSPDQAAAAVRALASDLEGLGGKAAVHDQLRQMAATMACHAAVKANDPLTIEKMQHILDELRRTAYSTVCPHGRPVMLRLSRREVEKNFQRI
jgi:DNA mismatch repair protein MutL